jgi:hypothetical protein
MLFVVVAGACDAGRRPEATFGPPATADSGQVETDDANDGDQHGADVEHTPENDPAASDPGPDEPTPSVIETGWGPIWDRLPAGFPVHPDSLPSETSTGPVTAVHIVDIDDVAEVTSWMQAALEEATYSTEALSGPLEGGTFVIDSVGDAGCRIEVTLAPLEGSTLVTVRYGADCPNE